MTDPVQIPPAPEPVTRDMRVLAAALAIVEAEFAFQAHRLQYGGAKIGTDNEAQYFRDLVKGYTTGAKFAAILRRYTGGRLRRAGLPVDDAPTVTDDILAAFPQAVTDAD